MTDRAGLTRRGMLAGATAAVAGAVGMTGAAGMDGVRGAEAVELRREPVGPRREPVELTWWGNHAWQIRWWHGDGADRSLADAVPHRHVCAGRGRSGDPIRVDRGVIDRHVTTAEAILVHHRHYDHLPDVPYIAQQTKATVLGTETHLNLLRAMRAPEEQLATVRGGEHLPFDGFTVDVFPSLHSSGGRHHRFAFPGTRPAEVPRMPRTIADLVEGGTLAYLVTIGGLRILSLSTAGFDPAALRDLAPDVVLAAPGGEPGVTDRLLQTLGQVGTVVATHWDDFDEPLDQPAVDWGGLAKLRSAVGAAAGAPSFVVVDHLRSVTL